MFVPTIVLFYVIVTVKKQCSMFFLLHHWSYSSEEIMFNVFSLASLELLFSSCKHSLPSLPRCNASISHVILSFVQAGNPCVPKELLERSGQSVAAVLSRLVHRLPAGRTSASASHQSNKLLMASQLHVPFDYNNSCEWKLCHNHTFPVMKT